MHEIASPVLIIIEATNLIRLRHLTGDPMQNKELHAHIEGCRRGESISQRWIFERYYRLMFGVCMRYVSDRDAVQDVVQEGFLKVFTNIEGYTFKGSFEGWIRRIMVNTSIDSIRRRKATGLVLGEEKSFEEVVDEEEEYDAAASKMLHEIKKKIFNKKEKKDQREKILFLPEYQ